LKLDELQHLTHQLRNASDVAHIPAQLSAYQVHGDKSDLIIGKLHIQAFIDNR
jgi:hypothetical protein